MLYTSAQIAKIKQKVIQHINNELDIANDEDRVDEVLEKYGIVFEENPIYVDTRTMKILVLGALSGSINDYKNAIKKLGIDPRNIEFEYEYNKLKRLDVSRLENSFEYSDILYGPNPHKQVNIGDNSSLLAMMKNNPEKFPRVIEMCSNNQLKITISNFRDAILKTRYFENM